MISPDPEIDSALKRLATSRQDDQAWSLLFRRMWPFIFSVVYRRMQGDRTAAEDATQEVFIRLVKSCPFDELSTADAFRGYAWRVADNVGRTYRQRRAKVREIQWIDEEPTEHQEPDFEIEIELDEILGDVWRNLDPAERKLLRLILSGTKLNEIARKCHLSYANAGVRVFRLRRKLRKSLISHGLMVDA
jgi:RNA polymerase sigma factor (sigma-70 family)